MKITAAKIPVGCRRLIVLSTICVGAMGVSCTAQVLLHDFDDGTIGDWALIDDLAAAESYGPTQYLVQDGQLIIGSNGPAPFVDNDPNAFFEMDWKPSVGTTEYTNGYLQATIRPQVRQAQSGILLRAGADPNEVDYEFWHNPDSGSFWFGRWDGPKNNFSVLKWTRSGVAPYEAGGEWIMKAGVVGNEISLKYWKPGDPEPGSPQLKIDDQGISPFELEASRIGLAMQGIPGSPRELRGAFDDIYFTAVPHLSNGDFDFDGDLDVVDVDMLVGAINSGATNLQFDKNGDSVVDHNDLAVWGERLEKTPTSVTPTSMENSTQATSWTRLRPTTTKTMSYSTQHGPKVIGTAIVSSIPETLSTRFRMGDSKTAQDH